jgi:glucosamine--fructose-6-phosphate aminotransferase (isomerizing)
MCGIVGYIGSKTSRSHVLDGLAQLEYRGYDAGGFGCFNHSNKALVVFKACGGIAELRSVVEKSPIESSIGIGHMRWSTHGAASNINNAHPHLDCSEKIAIVHNGIIENYHELKERLLKNNHIFRSETDTETVVHLFEELLQNTTTLKSALVGLVNELEGAFAFVCMLRDHPDTLLLVRKRSPLCVGIGAEEMFVGSDPLAFGNKAHDVLFMPDESFAIVNKHSIELYDFAGNKLTPNIVKNTYHTHALGKGNFEHYMLKEIYDQKRVLHETVTFLREMDQLTWDKIGLTDLEIQKLERINLVGCGTSWHAGKIAEFFFETIAGVPTDVHLASEFRYQRLFAEKNTVYIGISQSGETADTLEALRMVNQHNMPTVALTNVPSSSMVRECTGFLLTQAGPEIAVASTKAFTAQVASLYWLAHRIGFQKGTVTERQLKQAKDDLLLVAEVLENSIETYKNQIIEHDAPLFARVPQYIFLGRHISYPFALEAALKLKEIAYLFVDCYPAGELKHGPLALVQDGVPVVIFSSLDPIIYQKLLSNAQEVKARNGHLVAFCFEHQQELIKLANQSYILPQVPPLLAPLAMTGLMQYWVYQIAKTLQCPIDKPRNLAKSVTVE